MPHCQRWSFLQVGHVPGCCLTSAPVQWVQFGALISLQFVVWVVSHSVFVLSSQRTTRTSSVMYARISMPCPLSDKERESGYTDGHLQSDHFVFSFCDREHYLFLFAFFNERDIRPDYSLKVNEMLDWVVIKIILNVCISPQVICMNQIQNLYFFQQCTFPSASVK